MRLMPLIPVLSSDETSFCFKEKHFTRQRKPSAYARTLNLVSERILQDFKLAQCSRSAKC